MPTIYIGSCRDMMGLVKPPRSVFVDFPLGHPLGRPGDKDLQIRILKDALERLAGARVPGEIVELPYQWEKPFDWATNRRDMEAMFQEEGIQVQGWTPKD